MTELERSVIFSVVLGVPINDQGQFLLTQRYAPNYPDVHLKWQLAGGGIEFGETTEQTLAREFQEELGTAVEIVTPQPFVRTTVWAANPAMNRSKTHVTLICYVIRIAELGDHTKLDDETNAWKWFSLDEVMALETLPNTREFLLDTQQWLESYSAA